MQLSHMRVQCDDCSRKETVFKSVCLRVNASVTPARGQQIKKLKTRMRIFLDNALSSTMQTVLTQTPLTLSHVSLPADSFTGWIQRPAQFLVHRCRPHI